MDIPPFPDLPEAMHAAIPPLFLPSEEWATWIRETIIAEGGALVNDEHRHLRRADIAVLLTNVQNEKKGQQILGRAGLGEPKGSDAWKTGQRAQQLGHWFGRIPDFLVRLEAHWMHRQIQQGEPAPVLALIEHELFHCAQKTDRYGMPAFDSRTGKPKWGTRPHDSEQFIGVIDRYGPTSDAEREMQKAYASAPLVASADLDGICGTCGKAL